MSSFLNAAAPGAALVVLARGVPVSLATTAAQALVAPSQQCSVLYAVISPGATAWSSTTSFKVGVTTALSALVATTIATSLPSTQTFWAPAFTINATTAAAGPAKVAAGASIFFSMVQIDPTATAATVDLLGYLS